MKILKLIPILFIFFGNIPYKNEVQAEDGIRDSSSSRGLGDVYKRQITIIPIGIAYSKIPPNFRGEFCLSFGKPIRINDYINFTIKDFNNFLNEKMTQEEEKALKNVGR